MAERSSASVDLKIDRYNSRVDPKIDRYNSWVDPKIDRYPAQLSRTVDLKIERYIYMCLRREAIRRSARFDDHAGRMQRARPA